MQVISKCTVIISSMEALNMLTACIDCTLCNVKWTWGITTYYYKALCADTHTSNTISQLPAKNISTRYTNCLPPTLAWLWTYSQVVYNNPIKYPTQEIRWVSTQAKTGKYCMESTVTKMMFIKTMYWERTKKSMYNLTVHAFITIPVNRLHPFGVLCRLLHAECIYLGSGMY